MRFLGEVLLSAGAALRGHWTFRREDLGRVLADCSARAVAIVLVVNLLVGAILAFVGAVQLAKFGAGIFVADLVAIAVAREMAAIITAVVIAGRTGAAFAAEIATMQANEEVDALEVLGLTAIDFLVLPRVASLLLMMPLLYIFACVAGLLGGMIVAAAMLDLSAAAYLQRTAETLTWIPPGPGHREVGVFGALVGMVGCYYGLRAQRNAAGVGVATTERGGDQHRRHHRARRHLRDLRQRSGDLTMTLLAVDDLDMHFGERLIQTGRVVQGREGLHLRVMGGSGCGKSTLLKHLVGLLPPAAGTVTYDGVDYWASDDAQRRPLRVALRHAVPERGAVVVDDGARERLPAARAPDPARRARSARPRRARCSNGSTWASSPTSIPSDLSGGMKKRAGLARAIAAEPPLLFLDEPSAGLDPISSRRLDDLILDIRAAHRRGRRVRQPRAAEPVRDRGRRHLPRRRQQAADRPRLPARTARQRRAPDGACISRTREVPPPAAPAATDGHPMKRNALLIGAFVVAALVMIVVGRSLAQRQRPVQEAAGGA